VGEGDEEGDDDAVTGGTPTERLRRRPAPGLVVLHRGRRPELKDNLQPGMTRPICGSKRAPHRGRTVYSRGSYRSGVGRELPQNTICPRKPRTVAVSPLGPVRGGMRGLPT